MSGGLVLCVLHRRLYPKPIFGLVILGAITGVILMLSYVLTTLWQIDRPLYVVYPLVLSYLGYMLLAHQPND